MELHPILEHSCAPNPGLWYVLSALGDCPSVRVGHTLNYVPSAGGHSGKIYVIGGANPGGTFNETFVLDLETFSWDVTDQPGLMGRYEHSAFCPTSKPNKIYIFGGADQGRNHNDIQAFDLSTHTWSIITPSGTPPSARTYHNATSIGDRFIVYSGGQSGSDPVGDRQVHNYDATTNSWSTLNIRGDSPKPRHGHLIVNVGNKIIIHGGMSGTHFYDDLFVLDLDKNSWTNVKQRKVFPSARAAHSGVAVGTDIYVFGGMNRDGALDDLYKLDTETLKWTKIVIEGTPPACRLDFAMTAIRLRGPTIEPSVDETLSSSLQAKELLDSQLRMGSAGSLRSLSGSVSNPGSAGSQRSMSSLTGIPTVQEVRETVYVDGGPPPSSPTHPAPSSYADDGATASSFPEDDVPHKIVDLILIFGGMDTEGEIFDDCLVFWVKEEAEGVKAGQQKEKNKTDDCHVK